MEREHFDLRYVIECNMKSRSSIEGKRPFSKEEVESIMYHVVIGMDKLHRYNIVYRDLKVSIVLVEESKSDTPKYKCFVANYKCSVGVEGMGCFMAQEIL